MECLFSVSEPFQCPSIAFCIFGKCLLEASTALKLQKWTSKKFGLSNLPVCFPHLVWSRWISIRPKRSKVYKSKLSKLLKLSNWNRQSERFSIVSLSFSLFRKYRTSRCYWLERLFCVSSYFQVSKFNVYLGFRILLFSIRKVSWYASWNASFLRNFIRRSSQLRSRLKISLWEL